MSLVDTAMKYYNMMENMRDRERRDVQFSYQLSQWEHQERKMAFDAAEMSSLERTRTDREELRLQENRTKLGENKSRQLELYINKRKSIQTIIDDSQNDPEIIAWGNERIKSLKAELLKTVPQHAAYLADSSVSAEDKKRYIEQVMPSISDEMRKHGMDATAEQHVRDSLDSVMAGAAGDTEAIAKVNPPASIVAKSVLGIEVAQDEIIELEDSDKERVNMLLERAQNVWDMPEIRGDSNMSLLEKRVMAVKDAVQTLMGEDVPDARKFAITQAVAEGLEQYVVADRVKATTDYDQYETTAWSQAALKVAERGVEWLAQLPPDELLQTLGHSDQYAAWQEIQNIENSDKMHSEMRDRLASATGGDIHRAVREGHIDPNSQDFKRDVMLATVRMAARNAAMSPDVDGVAVQKALQHVEQELKNGNLSGEGAIWAMMDSVFERVQRSVPEIQARSRDFTPNMARFAQAHRDEGRIFMAKYGENNQKSAVAIPNVQGAEILTANYNDAFSIPRDLKLNDLGAGVKHEYMRDFFNADAPKAALVMANMEGVMLNLSNVINAAGHRRGVYDLPELKRVEKFHKNLGEGKFSVGRIVRSAGKRVGLMGFEQTGKESLDVSGEWRDFTKGMDKDRVAMLHGQIEAMSNARDAWEADDGQRRPQYEVQFMIAYMSAMQLAGVDFRVLGSKPAGYNVVSSEGAM